MVKAKVIEVARKAARKAIESTYESVCTIIEYQDIRDKKTKISHKVESIVVENQPCKLSFEKLNTVIQTKSAAALSQSIKLFLAPEIRIKPGSKIIVEQNNIMTEYSASGEPAVYPTHCEYMLELFKEWA